MRNKATRPAFLFDLDGTLVDTVYAHVIAWAGALAKGGMPMPAWRIHRYIGMSGGMFLAAFAREVGHRLTEDRAQQMEAWHKEAYARMTADLEPLPGAKEILRTLTDKGLRWAIATSGNNQDAMAPLRLLGLSPDAENVITGESTSAAKPYPDLFLAAADRIDVDVRDTIIVGDSVWDLLAAQRARALAVGVLTGGYSEGELQNAGAYRVYDDTAEMLLRLEEMGAR